MLFHGLSLYDQTRSIFQHYHALPDWEFLRQGEDLPVTEACQFNESDHNYLSRRWEAAGWHYAYEHTANGHKLILSDDSTLAESIDGVEIPFQRHAGTQEEDGMHEWSGERHIVPASVTLTSYDFKSPWPKTVEVPTSNVQGLVLRKDAYEYTGAYGFKDRQDGDHLATQRMEEFEHAAKFFQAAGNNRNVLPGRWFRLTGHFDGGSQEEREFLIIEAHHSASNNYHVKSDTRPHYENRISCIRKFIPWRPGRGFNSVEPKIYGLQTAKGGYDNANALRFEDKKGQEQLWLHAERDQLTEVEHDEDKWVGHDRRKTIDHDETSHIGHDRTETVDNDETITVHNNRTETVDNNETIRIGSNRTKTIGKNRKDQIGKNWSTHVARMKTETIGMAYLQNVGMGRMENVGLTYNLNVGTVMATVVGINQINKVGKTLSITAGEELSISVGKSARA